MDSGASRWTEDYYQSQSKYPILYNSVILANSRPLSSTTVRSIDKSTSGGSPVPLKRVQNRN